MASGITVYQKMTSSTDALMAVVRQEIGVKACVPFAVKAYEALAGLNKKGFTESDARKAANVFLSDLQTLTQGGVTTEDYDKIDFVPRGGTICVSARVEAFLRAAKRKGYTITDTIISVPKEDAATTYFEENFHNGNIIYTLKDGRKQGDRKITAERLTSGYFDRFICRLDICESKTGRRLLMTISEVSNEDVLASANASDHGLFKTEWKTIRTEWGDRKRKVITSEPNVGTIWRTWTTSMVEKTVLRKALKRVREVLPELTETILAFDTDVQSVVEGEMVIAGAVTVESTKYDVNAEPVPDVNIFSLTEEQVLSVDEMLEVYSANPKLAQTHAEEIKAKFESGEDVRIICNENYASIINIWKSKALFPLIKNLLEAAKQQMEGDSDEENKS